MINISEFCRGLTAEIPGINTFKTPWSVTDQIIDIVSGIIKTLSTDEYYLDNESAIHKTALVESNVTIKPHTVIGRNSIIKSGSYLRGGVYIGNAVAVGANCEIKQSIVHDQSRIAHLNYVGNSIIGLDVNLEAGSVLANRFNERQDKKITVIYDGELIQTHSSKFGSLVGDHSRIGANAVCSPGTILPPDSIVARLELVDQVTRSRNLKAD